MDRVYGANVVQQEPLFDAGAPSGFPTDGSSTGGISATVPKAAWYNAVTEEIYNAIKAGGITPERATLNQLAASIAAQVKTVTDALAAAKADLEKRVDKVELTPAGAIMAFARSSAPNSNWLVCDGRAVSRSTYANLFAAIGTTWGAGNGSTTFNLPDLRGVFLRGWDSGRGLDSGRGFATYQEDAIRNIVGTFDGNVDDGQTQKTGAFYYTGKAFVGSNGDGEKNGGVIGFDASRVVPTADENRPKNVAILYCIHI